MDHQEFTFTHWGIKVNLLNSDFIFAGFPERGLTLQSSMETATQRMIIYPARMMSWKIGAGRKHWNPTLWLCLGRGRYSEGPLHVKFSAYESTLHMDYCNWFLNYPTSDHSKEETVLPLVMQLKSLQSQSQYHLSRAWYLPYLITMHCWNESPLGHVCFRLFHLVIFEMLITSTFGYWIGG